MLFPIARFGHQYRRRGERIVVRLTRLRALTELQHPGRAAVHAGGTTNTLRVLHGQSFIGETHDVNALVAHRRANVAADAFFFIGKNAKTRKSRINMHQSGYWAGKTTPNTSRKPEITPYADDSRMK
jgi:hypothetical protein